MLVSPYCTSVGQTIREQSTIQMLQCGESDTSVGQFFVVVNGSVVVVAAATGGDGGGCAVVVFVVAASMCCGYCCCSTSAFWFRPYICESNPVSRTK